MGPYFHADKLLARQIAGALLERRRINANRKLIKETVQSEWRDSVNPTLFISHSEIKSRTHRDRMRESAYSCVIEHLLKYPELTSEIERDLAGNPIGLTISVIPVRTEDNRFIDLSNLLRANFFELQELPDLNKALT